MSKIILYERARKRSILKDTFVNFASGLKTSFGITSFATFADSNATSSKAWVAEFKSFCKDPPSPANENKIHIQYHCAICNLVFQMIYLEKNRTPKAYTFWINIKIQERDAICSTTPSPFIEINTFWALTKSSN